MLRKTTKDRKVSRMLILNGSVLIAISLILAILLGVLGCSGGPKKDPTDPVGSKPAADSKLRGAGSGGPSGQTSPYQIYGEQGRYLELLIERGGGQNGQQFSGSVLCGVFNAVTSEPIEDAQVALGADGEITGATDADGVVSLHYDLSGTPGGTPGPGGQIGNEIITAGAEDYEMLTFSNLRYNVCAFFINPLVAPAVDTGTISGTIDFNTDEFSGEVYATNMETATDAVLLPSGPGDETDTFEIEVEAAKEGVFICVMRDPTTHDILRFFTQRFNVESDDTLTIDQEYVAPSNSSLNIEPTVSVWVEYADYAKPFNGSVELVNDLADDIATLTASFSLNFQSPIGSLLLMDTTEYTTPGAVTTTDYVVTPGMDALFRHFTTTYLASQPPFIPANTLQLWVNVQYDDGSGSEVLAAYGSDIGPSSNVKLHTPPSLTAPANAATGTGLTPVLSWVCDPDEVMFGSVITLVDTENSNRWRIIMDAGNLTVDLPTLPDEMEGWGLTVSNDVNARVDLDMTLGTTVTSPDGNMVTFPPEEGIVPKNYSKIYTFTP